MADSLPSSPVLHFSIPDVGPDAYIDRAEASTTFAPLGKKPYTSVDIGGATISDGAATVAAEHLRSLARFNSLTNLSLADIVASLPADEAIRTISTLANAASTLAPSLRVLDVSDNALGSKGISALGPLLTKLAPSLSHLYLNSAGLDNGAAKLLPAFLAPRSTTALHTLHVAHAVLSGGMQPLVSVLEKSPRMTDVRFASLRADADEISKVLAAFKNGALVSLDLSDNSMSIDTALGFDTLIKRNPRLERLVLADMRMGDDSAYLVLKAVTKSGECISELDISGNSIGPKSASAIGAAVLARRNELAELRLSDNPVGADTAVGVSRVLGEAKTSVLRVLAFENVGIDDVAAARIALALRPLPLLEKLEIGGGELRQETVTVIQAALPRVEVVCNDAVAGREGEVAGLADLLERLAAPTDESPAGGDAGNTVDSGGGGSWGTNSILSKFFAGSPSAPKSAKSGASSVAASSIPPLAPGYSTPTRPVRSGRPDARSPSSSERNSAMVMSARQLRDTVDSLQREIGALTRSPLAREASYSALSSETSALVEPTRESLGLPGKSLRDELFDVLWACLLALFIVIVVVSIAHNQDERTFSMRPV